MNHGDVAELGFPLGGPQAHRGLKARHGRIAGGADVAQQDFVSANEILGACTRDASPK